MIVLLFCLNSIYGDESLSDVQFMEKMDHYYESPSQADFARIQKIISDNIAIMQKPRILAVKLARIAEKHSWPITMQNSVGCKAREILEGKSEFAEYINDDEQIDADKLDVWWASYYATGEKKYLEKLLRYAGEKGAGSVSRKELHAMPRKDAIMLVLNDTASWSFKSNCKQHDSIKGYAAECLRMSQYEHKKTFLEDCVKGSHEGVEAGQVQYSPPSIKFPDHRNLPKISIDTVEKAVKWAENGDLRYTLALCSFFRWHHREQLKWAKLTRKQSQEIISNSDLEVSLDRTDWELNISRLNTLISHLEGQLIAYARSEEEIAPDLKLAEKGDENKMQFLYYYFANRKDYDKALYWLEKCRIVTIKAVTDEAPKSIADGVARDWNKIFDNSKQALLSERSIIDVLYGGN
jgi:hypothetical protein